MLISCIKAWLHSMLRVLLLPRPAMCEILRACGGSLVRRRNQGNFRSENARQVPIDLIVQLALLFFTRCIQFIFQSGDLVENLFYLAIHDIHLSAQHASLINALADLCSQTITGPGMSQMTQSLVGAVQAQVIALACETG